MRTGSAGGVQPEHRPDHLPSRAPASGCQPQLPANELDPVKQARGPTRRRSRPRVARDRGLVTGRQHPGAHQPPRSSASGACAHRRLVCASAAAGGVAGTGVKQGAGDEFRDDEADGRRNARRRPTRSSVFREAAGLRPPPVAGGAGRRRRHRTRPRGPAAGRPCCNGLSMVDPLVPMRGTPGNSRSLRCSGGAAPWFSMRRADARADASCTRPEMAPPVPLLGHFSKPSSPGPRQRSGPLLLRDPAKTAGAFSVSCNRASTARSVLVADFGP